jgi:HSP20 family molecular chaperone IbpA
MKNGKGYLDMGAIFDEIFGAAQEFSAEIHRNFGDFVDNCNGHGAFGRPPFDESMDYYPNYSYPPMNVFMTEDRSLVFEFALAGFDEKDISLSFQGDYMVFSAKLNSLQSDIVETTDGTTQDAGAQGSGLRYFKRRLKLKDIEKQKYFVPLDKYAQENVRAVYKNGILKVTVPPKDEPDQSDGIRIEIVREGK